MGFFISTVDQGHNHAHCGRVSLATADPVAAEAVNMLRAVATPRAKINWVLAASLVGQGFTYKEVASKTGAKSGDVIRVGLARKGIRLAPEAEVKQAQQTLVRTVVAITGAKVNEALTNASKRLREKLSAEMEAQVAVLEQSPPKHICELASSKEGEGRASVAYRIAQTAALVHGDWEDSAANMVAAEYLSADHERQATVTAITNVSPSDAQVQQPQGQEVAKQPEAAKPVDPATLP